MGRFERRFPGRYFRLQEYLSGELATPVSDDLDDASPENIEAMVYFATELITKHRRDLDGLCAILADGASQPGKRAAS